ncbi:MAG: hypothetical protein OEZ04_07445 [Nitrospinota bacterium]|nr:hypothetical protein [Nitrospinota bacterium]
MTDEKQFPRGRLITCILPKGTAIPLMKKLREEKGITAMSFHHARGAGRSGRSRHGLGHYVENHIINIAVSTDQADDIFEFIYFEAHIGEDHNGLLLMEKLGMLTPYTLPEELQDE